VRSLPGWVQADGVVVAPADIQTDEHAVSAGHARCLSSVGVVAGRASMAGTHVPTRPTPRAAMSLFSDPSMPPIPVTPPPRSCGRLGRQSCRTWRPQRLDHEPRRR